MLSFDRLHTFPGGMFRQHLWEDTRELIQALGRDISAQIDKMCADFIFILPDLSLTTDGRADSVPRWRGLNHFKNYLTVEFTDGSKWEDMSKVCRD